MIRRGIMFCKSNYLGNPNFALQKLTRTQAMRKIMKCTAIPKVITLLCPGQGVEARYYPWKFTAINKYNTIEFRKGSASVSANLAFGWIELALIFVLISMQMGDMETLQQMPVNITSLKEYLSQEGEYAAPEIFDDAAFNSIFRGDKEPSVQPTPVDADTLSPEDQQLSQRKIQFDTEHNSMLEKLTPPPSFPARTTAAEACRRGVYRMEISPQPKTIDCPGIAIVTIAESLFLYVIGVHFWVVSLICSVLVNSPSKSTLALQLKLKSPCASNLELPSAEGEADHQDGIIDRVKKPKASFFCDFRDKVSPTLGYLCQLLYKWLYNTVVISEMHLPAWDTT